MANFSVIEWLRGRENPTWWMGEWNLVRVDTLSPKGSDTLTTVLYTRFAYFALDLSKPKREQEFNDEQAL